MRSLSMLLAGLLLCAASFSQASTVYKWIDNQGQTHFGSQPPAGQDSERITTRTRSLPAPTAGTPAPAVPAPQESKNQKEIDTEVKRQVAQEQAELKTYCTEMRTRLAQLRNNPRLLAEVDGQMVRLSEEERQSRITEAEEKIGEHCSNL